MWMRGDFIVSNDNCFDVSKMYLIALMQIRALLSDRRRSSTLKCWAVSTFWAVTHVKLISKHNQQCGMSKAFSRWANRNEIDTLTGQISHLHYTTRSLARIIFFFARSMLLALVIRLAELSRSYPRLLTVYSPTQRGS